MNFKKLLLLSQVLDSKGQFIIADKIEKFIKTSQSVKLPSMYEATTPDIPNELLGNMFKNISQTSMGSQFADGGQVGMTGTYRSKFGPKAPLVLPTLTPTQMMEMEKSGRYQDIANIMMLGGMQLEQYSRLGNERLIGLATLLSQYNQPNVSQKVKSQFFSYFPSTVSSLMMQDLSVRPLKDWAPRVQEYLNVLQKNAPKYMSNFNTAISEALLNHAMDIRYKNQNQYAALLKDKDWQALAAKFNVMLPKLTDKPGPLPQGPTQA